MSTTKMCLACNREYADEIERCPSDGVALISLSIEPDFFDHKRFESYERLAKGRYTLIGKAIRKSDNRMVVLKTLPSASPEILNKYHQEAKTLTKLRHEGIVQLLESGPLANNTAYFSVLEYIGKDTVQDLIDRNKQLTLPQMRSIVLAVCDALTYLHSKQSVHPFLKPSHIVLTDADRRPVLVDFADQYYAHDMRTISYGGAIVANGEYAAPEVLVGKPIDARSNVYSLGCIIYAMLTGQPPFVADNQFQLASKQMTEMPKPLSKTMSAADLPENIEKAVMSMLEKDPRKRPAIRQIRKTLS